MMPGGDPNSWKHLKPIWEAVAAKVNKALLERRIITGTSSDPKVLRLLPPLCLTVDEAGLFVEALKAL